MVRSFYAIAALCLTDPTANNNRLASGLDYWPISGVATFNEAKGEVDELYSRYWYEMW